MKINAHDFFGSAPRRPQPTSFATAAIATDFAVDLGFNVDFATVDFSAMKQREPAAALYRMQRALPTHVWNAAALEGNTYTLPEVRTLLDNVTVGGHTVAETDQIAALIAGYQLLDQEVRSGTFRATKQLSDRLHLAVGKFESLDAGRFRGEGSSAGGGHVRLTTGEVGDGIAASQLPAMFDNLIFACNQLADPRQAALLYFAGATRYQFYFDANKRTARLFASGMLLSAGFDAIRIPSAARLVYNQALNQLFSNNDAQPLINFLVTTFRDDLRSN